MAEGIDRQEKKDPILHKGRHSYGHSSVSCYSSIALITAAFDMGCDGSGDPTAPLSSVAATLGTSSAAKQVPFKATFEGNGTASAVPGDRCPDLIVEIRGTGQGTHLGRLTTNQRHCATPTSLSFTDGLFTLTAANGDQLRGTYSGDFVPLDPPLFTIDGQFTFTGGTGRFTGATGGGDASGVQNLATGEATVSLAGTLSSVGSN